MKLIFRSIYLNLFFAAACLVGMILAPDLVKRFFSDGGRVSILLAIMLLQNLDLYFRLLGYVRGNKQGSG